MMVLSFPAFLLFLAVISAASDTDLWDKFKENYGKVYRSAKEDEERFAVFQHNLRKIEDHNRKFIQNKSKYRLGINKFTDLSQEEFIKQRLSASTTHVFYEEALDDSLKNFKNENDELPDSIDWRDVGAVTDVKDQGQCGAGWAFATTGSLEGQLFLVNNTLLSLSEQYLIDCDNITISNYNNGCDGGRPLSAMSFLRNMGIPEETAYPYKGEQGDCLPVEPYIRGLKNYHRTTMDEKSLMNSVGTAGPVAVELDATNFQLYDGGIFDDTKCSMIVSNHAALVVGYDTDEYGYDYWLVKNSWGSDWGEFGYIRLERGFNQCGVATDTVYPEL